VQEDGCSPVPPLTAELEAAAPENITVLSDDVLVLDGVRFLGSTLWTDFKLRGEGEAWFARERWL